MLLRRVAPWRIAIAIFCGCAPLAAQLDRGTIRGAIVDATGSVLSRVAVSASNVDTGIVTSGETNDQGLYSLLNLPVGRYTVTFTRDGFASTERHGVIVGVQSALRIDIQLQLEGRKDSVTVGVNLGAGNCFTVLTASASEKLLPAGTRATAFL